VTRGSGRGTRMFSDVIEIELRSVNYTVLAVERFPAHLGIAGVAS
jgi:hypothetical protein